MDNKFEIQFANYVGACKAMDFPVPAKPVSKPALSDNERKIFAEAEKAWINYSNSVAGKYFLTELKSMDLPTAQSSVAKILDNPEFDKLKNLLNTLDLRASSFSIGISFEAEFILGIAGTLGFAIGIGGDKGVSSSEFLSVWIMEGIELGALVGVQFGLWDSAPADLGGYAWGTEVALGFEVEASGCVLYSKSEKLLGVTMTIGAGLDEGFAEVESFTFILGTQGENPYLEPVYQPRKNNFLIIESLTCVHPSSDGAGDENEIYFTFQADGGGEGVVLYRNPPYSYFSMKEKDVWECGRSVWFNSNVQVTVYDDDGTSGNDVVGTFSINLSELTLDNTKTYNSTDNYSSGFDDVEYTINVKLIAQNVVS